MSLVNRNNLNYLYSVEQYFLSLTEHGAALSPLDYEAIKSWKKRGVPLNVACSGIKKGIESFRRTHGRHRSLPRSIRYCAILVENEFIKHKRLLLGAHCKEKNDIDEKKILLRKIEELISKITEVGNREKNFNFKVLYDNARDRILYLRTIIENNCLSVHSELEKIERFFLNEFCKLISQEELTQLMKEIEGQLSSQKSKMNEDAYKKTLESQRNLLVRKRYGLFRIEIGG